MNTCFFQWLTANWDLGQSGHRVANPAETVYVNDHGRCCNNPNMAEKLVNRT